MTFSILAVSTSETHRHLILSTLNEHQVLLASSSHEAFHYLDVNPDIDLIILDLNIHDGETLLILDGLNSKGYLGKKKTIVLTDPEGFKQGIGIAENDNADWIVKPIDSELLKIKVGALIKSLDKNKYAVPKDQDQIELIQRALAESERSKTVLLSHLPGWPTGVTMIPIGLCNSFPRAVLN